MLCILFTAIYKLISFLFGFAEQERDAIYIKGEENRIP